MMHILLQATGRVDPREVLQRHFAKDAWDTQSWTGFIAVAAAIAIFVVILHFILYYQKRVEQTPQLRRPDKLFREVTRLLGLTSQHRAVLSRIAGDLKMRSPTSMLLSPASFSAASQQWLSLQDTSSGKHEDELHAIARLLFPNAGDS